MGDEFKKIMIIGGYGVGKRSLVVRFIEDKFYSPYPGPPIFFKKLKIKDKKRIKLEFYAHNSSEKCFQLTPSLYDFKGTDAIILVYDARFKDTLEILTKALEYANKYIPKEFPIMLIGNKIDEHKEVTTEEGQDFANNNGFFAFYETSAKENINVKECFNKVIKKILNLDDKEEIEEVDDEEEEEEEEGKEKQTKKGVIKIEKTKKNKEKKKCIK